MFCIKPKVILKKNYTKKFWSVFYTLKKNNFFMLRFYEICINAAHTTYIIMIYKS